MRLQRRAISSAVRIGSKTRTDSTFTVFTRADIALLTSKQVVLCGGTSLRGAAEDKIFPLSPFTCPPRPCPRSLSPGGSLGAVRDVFSYALYLGRTPHSSVFIGMLPAVDAMFAEGIYHI